MQKNRGKIGGTFGTLEEMKPTAVQILAVRNDAIFTAWDERGLTATQVNEALGLTITVGHTWAVISQLHRERHQKRCKCIIERGHRKVDPKIYAYRMKTIRAMRGRIPREPIREIAVVLELSKSRIHVLMQQNGIE